MRIFIFFLILSSQTWADSLGVVGEVFPVAEKSLLVLIQERLKNHKGPVIQEEIHPKSVGLPKAYNYKKSHYRPEITVDNDILDNEGRILIAKGITVNALEKLPSYNPCWFFINASIQKEMRWIKKTRMSCSNPKIILTEGEISKAEENLESPIYFDQNGRITKKLGIEATPARVTRENDHLVIEEFAL